MFIKTMKIATRALIYSTEQGYTGCFEERSKGGHKENEHDQTTSAGNFQFKPKGIVC
jgi:hypothetical protein